MILQVFFILITGTSVLGASFNLKIVNGTDAAPGEFPFIVSLRYSNSHNCGGSIVSEQFVITAAHCVKGYPQSTLNIQYGVTEIAAGLDAPNLMDISKIIIHEDYVPGSGYYNDIALLKLASPLTFNDLVQPIRLPKAFNATPENNPAVLIGWGLEKSGGQIQTHLQKVDIIVFSDDDCESIHKNTGPTNREYHVCAGIPEGGKGQCNGDSGGPLIVNKIQVGLVSWSVKPCTVKGYPGVFTKSSRHINWIQENILKNS